MTHTIKEAQELWCPMMRSGEQIDGYIAAYNRSIPRSACCIASMCAMWRHGEPRLKKTEVTVPISETKEPPFPVRGRMYRDEAWNVWGYPSMNTVRLWKFDDEQPAEPTGYCGLAGRPEVI